MLIAGSHEPSGSERFDLFTGPLEGTNLIEASAGTGKTYTLTLLFLRLILQKRLPVHRILVVTFTEAAAGELQDRIRTQLRRALDAVPGGACPDKSLQRILLSIENQEAAAEDLRNALRSFDQAIICTIHAFCRRVLHENAFESGVLFDTRLVSETAPMRKEVVEDFWRLHFYNLSGMFLRYALNRGVRPDTLFSLLRAFSERPGLRIVPEVEDPLTDIAEKAFKEVFARVARLWSSSRGEVEEILLTHPALNRNSYRKDTVPLWIRGMDRFLSSGGPDVMLFTGLEKFAFSEICKGTRKACSPPSHVFFELCQDLLARKAEVERLFEQKLLHLKNRLFAFERQELGRRKAENNIRSFEDLLLNLDRALAGPDGEALAAAVQRRLAVALIDEFQDTDPLQYAIFRKLFGRGGNALFLIGDPKQAIYSFRGADVFAYMDAAVRTDSRFTLRENWRSEPGLIKAVNTLFGRVGRPFIYEKIPFQAVEKAAESRIETLVAPGEDPAPLRIWYLTGDDPEKPGKPISKEKAGEIIPRAVAAEISRLLAGGGQGRIMINDRPLQENHIAVLVRTNKEARTIQQALAELHIPGVLYSTAHLFDTPEALEMERLLSAVAEPHDEKLVRAALSTEMLGLGGEELDALMEEGTGWERLLVRFKDDHLRWSERGLMHMYRHMFNREEVLVRLMKYPDGERRCTNLLHLVELLHRTGAEKRLSMTGLLKWLREQRDPNGPRSEEHQLRLEGDENAVNIVTIHRSKGLEYPVVFCPFLWEGSRVRDRNGPFTFHDRGTLTLDLGSPVMERNRSEAEKELLAENLRLLYVALTRARNRCYLVWGRFNQADTSAAAYLFHYPGPSESEGVVENLSRHFKSLTDDDLVRDLLALQAEGRGAVSLEPLPEADSSQYVPALSSSSALSCRSFSGRIDRQWRMCSFSSLVSGLPHSAELADRDDAGPPPDTISLEGPEEPVSGIFSFPKGAAAGIFMHELLEQLDFTETDILQPGGIIAEKLRKHGFETGWEEEIRRMVNRVLNTTLDPAVPGLLLSKIPLRDRLNELEFWFPLARISPARIRRLFQAEGVHGIHAAFPEQIERLDFSPARGYMRGFMDLVFQFEGRFYLVDWKSNYLGARIEDYDQEALGAAMSGELYILQYHIYVLALHRYLELRIPGYDYEKHFGGIYYIFLRGVDPDRGHAFGIYRARPPGEFMDRLGRALIPGAQNAPEPRSEDPGSEP